MHIKTWRLTPRQPPRRQIPSQPDRIADRPGRRVQAAKLGRGETPTELTLEQIEEMALGVEAGP
jgi:hypothetical protein